MHYGAILVFELRFSSFNGEVLKSKLTLVSTVLHSLVFKCSRDIRVKMHKTAVLVTNFVSFHIDFWFLSLDTSRAFLMLFQKQIKEAAVHVEREWVYNLIALFESPGHIFFYLLFVVLLIHNLFFCSHVRLSSYSRVFLCICSIAISEDRSLALSNLRGNDFQSPCLSSCTFFC